MGTVWKENRLLTNGGRVLMVVSKGSDHKTAKERVYSEIDKIKCDNLFHRKDIAHWAVEN